MYGLLTKCEVKMAGYWPSSFFASLWTETESRSINTQKKNQANQAILTEQAWSIKDLLYGFWENFSCGTRRVVPSGQDGSILPARVANHSAGFDSSCPLAELSSHIINIHHIHTILHFPTVHCHSYGHRHSIIIHKHSE